VREIREALGYSAFADYLLSRLNPNFWHGEGAYDLYQKSGADEVAVTCALLERLKKRADQDGIRVMLFLQYYATLILGSDRPGPPMTRRRSKTASITAPAAAAPRTEPWRAARWHRRWDAGLAVSPTAWWPAGPLEREVHLRTRRRSPRRICAPDR